MHIQAVTEARVLPEARVRARPQLGSAGYTAVCAIVVPTAAAWPRSLEQEATASVSHRHRFPTAVLCRQLQLCLLRRRRTQQTTSLVAS